MVRELISKIGNRNAAGLSNVVSEIVETAGKAGVEMITEIVNQIRIYRRSPGNNNKVK